MPLQRHDHWDTTHFHEFLLDRADKPFEWGTNDCCLFAADAIHAYTGMDIAADFRGKYTTEFGALKTIHDVTGGSNVTDAVAYCAAKHELVEHTHPLMAKRGDLVLIPNGDNLIAGVVHLNGSDIISVSETGLVRLPITSVTRAWSV